MLLFTATCRFAAPFPSGARIRHTEDFRHDSHQTNGIECVAKKLGARRRHRHIAPYDQFSSHGFGATCASYICKGRIPRIVALAYHASGTSGTKYDKTEKMVAGNWVKCGYRRGGFSFYRVQDDSSPRSIYSRSSGALSPETLRQ